MRSARNWSSVMPSVYSRISSIASSISASFWRETACSERTDEVAFDERPKARLQRLAFAEVHRDAEKLVEIRVDRSEVEEAEASCRVEVDEQVDVACRVCLIPSY